jgi:hypothetical protein
LDQNPTESERRIIDDESTGTRLKRFNWLSEVGIPGQWIWVRDEIVGCDERWTGAGIYAQWDREIRSLRTSLLNGNFTVRIAPHEDIGNIANRRLTTSITGVCILSQILARNPSKPKGRLTNQNWMRFPNNWSILLINSHLLSYYDKNAN